jgi:integrase
VLAAHPCRNGFATWVFQSAATGWFPPRAARATACWLPIARGLTPHGLRHSYKTMMLELGTPQVLTDEQLGHSTRRFRVGTRT